MIPYGLSSRTRHACVCIGCFHMLAPTHTKFHTQPWSILKLIHRLCTENPAQIYIKRKSDLKAVLVAYTDIIQFQWIRRPTLQQFFSSKSLVKMITTVESSTGLQIYLEVMRESFWSPLLLLNIPNLCELLRREAIKQNDLDKLKTHCPKSETIHANESSYS